MLPTPRKFTIVAGSAEGTSRLNAFDNALLASGLGNLNLLKVSSILPPSAEYVENLNIPPGSLTPTAYGTIVSDCPGELISAAVAIGFTEETFGVIMEFSGKCSKDEAERTVRKMVEEAFASRGLHLARTMVKGVEHTVGSVGCAFAAVALWY